MHATAAEQLGRLQELRTGPNSGAASEGNTSFFTSGSTPPSDAGGPDAGSAGGLPEDLSQIPACPAKPLHLFCGAGGLAFASAGQPGWSCDTSKSAVVTIKTNCPEEEVFHMEAGKLVHACWLMDGVHPLPSLPFALCILSLIHI